MAEQTPEDKETDKQPPAEQRAEPPRRRSDPETDPFILEKLHPKPADIFGIIPSSIAEIAKDCIFVIDTNSLLAPFAVGSKSFDDVARILRDLAKQKIIFVPARVAREYAKNRPDQLRNVHTHLHRMNSAPPIQLNIPMLQGTKEYIALQHAIEKLKEPIKAYKERLEKMLEHVKTWNWNDPVSKLYAEIFTAETIIDHDRKEPDIKTDLARRWTHKIPPGYKDQGKPDIGIGDLLIWYSIIKAGSSQKKNVVFVSSDNKPDWMVQSEKHALLIRFELVEEFNRETGKQFGIIDFGQLLKLYGASPDTVNEVKSAIAPSEEDYITPQHIYTLLKTLIAPVDDYLNGVSSNFADLVTSPDFNSGVFVLRGYYFDYLQYGPPCNLTTMVKAMLPFFYDLVSLPPLPRLAEITKSLYTSYQIIRNDASGLPARWARPNSTSLKLTM